jgi:hypothetical protein
VGGEGLAVGLLGLAELLAVGVGERWRWLVASIGVRDGCGGEHGHEGDEQDDEQARPGSLGRRDRRHGGHLRVIATP